MAQLNVILGSIMRDIIMAQHEANLYSRTLVDYYPISSFISLTSK